MKTGEGFRRGVCRVGTGAAAALMLVASVYAEPAALEPAAQGAGKFHDPLDTPARMRSGIEKRPLMAVTAAGERRIAVGLRGLIAASDDSGKTWSQMNVPVQSDLLAAHFPTATDGWAVGHDGVVLHSVDGGKTWEKQLDGRQAGERFKAYYTEMGANGAAFQFQIDQNYKAGPALPFLDVWFEDARHGYAVGSYGMLIATADGGKTWEPWLHRIDNPQFLNLNAIRGIGSELYIVGERGQVYRLDRSKNRFIHTDTGYIGSFFGILGNGSALVAYGLRGTLYQADAKGAAWKPVTMPNEQTLSAGIARRDGSFVLVNAAGEFLLLDKAGQTPRLVKPAGTPMRMTGIVARPDDAVIVVGLDGVRTETLTEGAPVAR